jgi:hypothetical protein
MNIIEQELTEHQAIQQRMVVLAKRMLASKHELQKEIREDMKNPFIRKAIEELKLRNASK